MPAPGMHSGLPSDPSMDLRMSDGGGPALRRRVRVHRGRGQPGDRGVLPPRRGPAGALGLRRRPARDPRRPEGEGARRGPVELLPARRGHGRRPVEPGLRLHRVGARQEPDRLRGLQLLGPRHRQHGGARARRHPRATAAVARAAPRGGDPLGVHDDRARRRVVRCHQHRVPSRARRRRVGHQR